VLHAKEVKNISSLPVYSAFEMLKLLSLVETDKIFYSISMIFEKHDR
jgi:hypothetical protein